jgi:hypothetical protein
VSWYNASLDAAGDWAMQIFFVAKFTMNIFSTFCIVMETDQHLICN